MLIAPKPRTTGWTEWGDGALGRELLRGPAVYRWNATAGCEELLVRFNATPAFRAPALVADLVGHWREELLLPGPDGKSLHLYRKAVPTSHRLPALLHDPQYRLAIAWQNAGYHMPPHPSCFPGFGMARPPRLALSLLRRGEAVVVRSQSGWR